MGVLIYDPPRNGPTLWDIGIPDRTAAEFYVPEPNPTLLNKLYVENTVEKLVLINAIRPRCFGSRVSW